MSRSRVVFLCLAVAGVFWIAGLATGYWVIPDSRGDTAECIALRHLLNSGDYTETRADIYNRNCR